MHACRLMPGAQTDVVSNSYAKYCSVGPSLLLVTPEETNEYTWYLDFVLASRNYARRRLANCSTTAVSGS